MAENEKCFCHLNGIKVKDADALHGTDETLSIAGMAADAQAVSEKIDEVASAAQAVSEKIDEVASAQAKKNQYLDDDIEDLMHRHDELAKKMELLWENAAPTSSFSPQHVQLAQSAENYNMLCILWRHSSGLGYILPSFVARAISTRTSLVNFKPGTIGSNTLDETYRYVNWFDDATDLSFHRGYRGSTPDNSGAIPVAVYGFNL